MHTRLQGRIANPTFDRLDFALIIFGELGIIEDPEIPEVERRARIKQLKRLCQYSRNFELHLIREFHSAFLTGVERSGTWDIDVNELAAQILFAPRPPVQLAQVGPPPLSLNVQPPIP